MSIPSTRSRLVHFGVWLLTASLSGCGFELRGTYAVPEGVSPLYVQGGGTLARLVQQSIVSSGQELAATPSGARGVIRIHNERLSSRVLSVNKGGKEIAQELHYQVEFSASSTAGKEPIPLQTIELARTYINPDTEVLGKLLEADQLSFDLREDAAQQILQRIATQWR